MEETRAAEGRVEAEWAGIMSLNPTGKGINNFKNMVYREGWDAERY